MHSAFITGVSGSKLTPDEKSFIRDTRPAGFILFQRNCTDKAQLSALIESVHDALQSDDLLVLVDQEGGRVQRMAPPHWRQYPAAMDLAQICDADQEEGEEALRLVNRAIARDLRAVGINMNCTPVLDLAYEGAHDIIGNRAYGHDAETVARRARIVAGAHLECGVAPVIKHIPGHGRATKDSHKALPEVDTARAELEATDFSPFRQLNDLPAAMTAHILYTRIDERAPASTSHIVINDIIREHIGFDGLLMSDDLSMRALQGDIGRRTAEVLNAGCDLALHCNGDFAEMLEVAKNAPELSAAGLRRFIALFEALKTGELTTDPADEEKLTVLLARMREKA